MMDKGITDCYLSMSYTKVAAGVDFGKFTLDCEGEHVSLVTLIVQSMQREKKVRKALIDAVGYYKKTYK